MLGGIGAPELLLMLAIAIALIVLGPRKPPEVGGSLGSGMRQIKDGLTGRGGTELEGESGV